MKSVFVTHNQPCSRYARLAFFPLLVLIFALSSCQKESVTAFELPEKAVVPTQVNARSTSVEADVLAHTQWVIDYMLPLAFDANVRTDLLSGNTSSAAVTAKLAALGFSSFEQFSQAYRASGSSVMAAIHAGNLSGTAIQQMVAGHEFDFGPLDDGPEGAALPCTQQLQTALLLTPVVIMAAAETGPGAIVAGVIHVLIAYMNFQDCMKASYPQGN